MGRRDQFPCLTTTINKWTCNTKGMTGIFQILNLSHFSLPPPLLCVYYIYILLPIEDSSLIRGDPSNHYSNRANISFMIFFTALPQIGVLLLQPHELLLNTTVIFPGLLLQSPKWWLLWRNFLFIQWSINNSNIVFHMTTLASMPSLS